MIRASLGCDSCEVLRINGVRCHETGCPDAWRDELRDCPECGFRFLPEMREQRFCDPSCHATYLGLPCEDRDDDTLELTADEGARIDAMTREPADRADPRGLVS